MLITTVLASTLAYPGYHVKTNRQWPIYLSGIRSL